MEIINLSKDLQNLDHQIRYICYYFGIWYIDENIKNDKEELYSIYKYLVDVNPNFEDIFINIELCIRINNILKKYIINIGDDYQSRAFMADIQMTLEDIIEKKKK